MSGKRTQRTAQPTADAIPTVSPGRIPLGIPLAEAARLHAEEMHQLWARPGREPPEKAYGLLGIVAPTVKSLRGAYRLLGVDAFTVEPLKEAHRLLDVDALATALHAHMRSNRSRAGMPQADAAGAFHYFPSYTAILPRWRQWVWGMMLEGRLIVTGLSAVLGKRSRVPAERLRLLEPDWTHSVLLDAADGSVALRDVQVGRPVAPHPEQEREPLMVRAVVSDAAMRRCFGEIVVEYADKPQPTLADLWGEAKTRLRGVTRGPWRGIVKDNWPAHWVRRRGPRSAAGK